MAIARADCRRTFHSDRAGRGRRPYCWRRVALALPQDRLGLHTSCLWTPTPDSQDPSPLGRNANRLSRSLHLVLPDGFRSRRRIHAIANLAENVTAPRHGGHGWSSPRRFFRSTVVGTHRSAGTHARISSGNWISRLARLQEVWS